MSLHQEQGPMSLHQEQGPVFIADTQTSCEIKRQRHAKRGSGVRCSLGWGGQKKVEVVDGGGSISPTIQRKCEGGRFIYSRDAEEDVLDASAHTAL